MNEAINVSCVFQFQLGDLIIFSGNYSSPEGGANLIVFVKKIN